MAAAAVWASSAARAAGPTPALDAASVAQAAGLDRPRIGLALSGGGARGFAHVGILRALEALRIPVDCIAGTSAGSAVGAAYAVGLDPDAIERQLRAANWGSMFSDQPPRPALPYRHKLRPESDPTAVTLGVGSGGIRGSVGIFAGQQIELFLHQLLGISDELADFDRLPIPYRAITTDIATGHLVVQDRGSLVHAVRASMAVPSAFAPVRVGDKRLVDGGLTQNLPVQTVRGLCADVVIAVNIASPLLKADEIDGVFGVALQMVSILMERNVADSLAALRPEDVLIVPDLTGVSAADFSGGVNGIPAGEAAILAARDRLQHLALTADAYAQWQAQRQARVLPPTLVARAEVAPTRFVAPDFFNLDPGRPRPPGPGPVDTAGLHRRIQTWAAGGDFTSIGYSLRPDAQGSVLWIDAQEKPWGPDYLHMGFGGQSDSDGNADFSVQLALRRTWMNNRGAEWTTRARFGRSREVMTRWYQPLAVRDGLFVQAQAVASSVPRRVFVGSRSVGEFRVGRERVDLSLGAQGPLGLVAAGLVASRIDTRPSVGFTEVSNFEAAVNGTGVNLVYDQLDDLDFPRHGAVLRVDSFSARRALGADTDYSRHEVSGLGVSSFGEHTLRLRARWGRVDSGGEGLRDTVSVGGFLDLSGYPTDRFIGSEVALLSLGYVRRLLPLPQPFGSGLFAGAVIEAARIHSPLGQADAAFNRYGAAVYVGAATALGPAYLGLGVGQGGSRILYLVVGRP